MYPFKTGSNTKLDLLWSIIRLWLEWVIIGYNTADFYSFLFAFHLRPWWFVDKYTHWYYNPVAHYNREIERGTWAGNY